MDAQIKLRGDTAANWTSENPVLADREMGIEKGTPIKLKFGDGTTAWNDLPYFGGAGTVETDTSLIGDGSSGDLLSVSGFETHVTAAGTTTLTDASASTQMFTGTNIETIYMPPAADIKVGREYWIINRSSGDITLLSAGGGMGSALNIVKTNGICVLRLIANSGAGTNAWHAITTYTFAGVTMGDISSHLGAYGGGPHDIPTPTAANDVQVGNGVSGVGARWIKKTLAEFKTILGLGTAAYTASTDYQPVDSDLTAIAGLSPADDDIIQRKAGAWVNRTMAQLGTDLASIFAPIAKGVTNGDSHDHSGGDGAAIVEAAITLADNTTNNASTSNHGFLKKLSNVATQWMNGLGNWTTPKAAILYTTHGGAGTIGASTTNYAWMGASGLSATERGTILSRSGTLKNMYIRVVGTQPGTGTLVMTCMVDGVATSLVITVPINQGNATLSDTAHTVAFTAGSSIDFRLVNNATGTSISINSMTVELEYDVT